MVHLGLVWHMHQPWYRAPAGGGLELPWVRLHGVKDYLDMPLRVEAVPGMRATFNLVPSLMAQIEAYGEGEVDADLDLSGRDPATLAPEETAALLAHFFPAPHSKLDAPFEAYRRLRSKRDALAASAGGTAASLFTAAEILDIQVYWNLAWIDPMFRDDPALAPLVRRGGGFTREERDRVLDFHRTLLGRIVPCYRRLEESGRAELTTSPFYHPILPLLCDTDSARRGLPGAPLPRRRLRAPGDARRQVAGALEEHARRFGRRPRGLWPSEGSVSDESAAIAAEAGLQWIASDEEILRLSLGEAAGPDWRRRLPQPYRLETASGPISIVFRDKELSDLIGFVYMRWEPHAAAADFVERVKAAGRSAAVEGPPLVSVILDGENCWEYYEQDGGPFLEALYARIAEDPEIVPTTPSAFIAEHAPRAVLRALFPGSWIDHSFHMWIGEPAKNRAWDLLAAAREALQSAEAGGEGDTARARHLLDAAEGSDWFWWYKASPMGPPEPAFDALYRAHLQEIYRAIGRNPPRELFDPITGRAAPAPAPETVPVGIVRPVIDGKVTSFYEWAPAGHVEARARGASMQRGILYLSDLFYGFDLATFYARIDLTEEGRSKAEALTIVFEFLAPSALRAAVSVSAGRGGTTLRLEGADRAAAEIGRAGFGRVLEVALPFADLGIAPGDEVAFRCHAAREGRVLESFPPLGQVTFRAPTPDFEGSMWSAS